MATEDLRIWLNHFAYHSEHPRFVPSGLGDVLTAHERERIASSIATFQLGELSAGATLLKATERLAMARNLPLLPKIMELFVREEQRHASLLREFMEDHRIPLKRRDWTDQLFRGLRRVAGLELYLHVLIVAELIGKVYYRALEAATECQRLRILCRILVCDELAHVGFESQLLLALRAERPAPVRALARLAHRAFFAGAVGVVWITHRAVLRSAGHSPRSFLRSCLAQFAFYLEPTKAALAATAR